MALTQAEAVAALRKRDPDLAGEFAAWRCPTETLSFGGDDGLPSGICGAPAVRLSEDCTATQVRPLTEGARLLLSHGIDPGPPDTEIRPVAYDLTFGCANGHTHYVRTRSVKT